MSVPNAMAKAEEKAQLVAWFRHVYLEGILIHAEALMLHVNIQRMDVMIQVLQARESRARQNTQELAINFGSQLDAVRPGTTDAQARTAMDVTRSAYHMGKKCGYKVQSWELARASAVYAYASFKGFVRITHPRGYDNFILYYISTRWRRYWDKKAQMVWFEAFANAFAATCSFLGR